MEDGPARRGRPRAAEHMELRRRLISYDPWGVLFSATVQTRECDMLGLLFVRLSTNFPWFGSRAPGTLACLLVVLYLSNVTSRREIATK